MLKWGYFLKRFKLNNRFFRYHGLMLKKKYDLNHVYIGNIYWTHSKTFWHNSPVPHLRNFQHTVSRTRQGQTLSSDTLYMRLSSSFRA